MGQAKVIVTGFRDYEVLKLAVTDAVVATSFNKMPEGHVEYMEVVNSGDADCEIWFNKVTNDRLTIKAGTSRTLAIKATKIFTQCAAGQSTQIEVIGYAE